MPKKTLLLLTDFSYQAKGREYFREDVELSILLRNHFNVCTSHINDTEKTLNISDAILIRNTGPQLSHQEQLMTLRKRTDLPLFNDLSGKGDINGKQHLLDLFESGFPVIPTFNSKEKIKQFGSYDCYLLKPLNGADSHGVKILTRDKLLPEACQNVLIQPLIEFVYEVSFYFIGNQFQYALYAPNPQKRWAMEPFVPSKEDVDFAQTFITWNTCKFGIQRVDACRLKNGSLLLMELEDYNPFLSLDLLDKNIKEKFVKALCDSLEELMSKVSGKRAHIQGKDSFF
ncbi:MAG: hypothetical protein JSS09_10170 [Verrucomicrobia bacterium]|nr:hypothetical protein [Verrucomicrobiota bacterium]